jgi:MtN3 and saliva related transmembrane protein
MDITEISGILASIFTGIALLPQLIDIIKNRKPATTPALTLISLFIGLCFWVAYGIFKNDWIIIISNGFSLLVNILIGLLSFYYPRKDKWLSRFLIGKW